MKLVLLCLGVLVPLVCAGKHRNRTTTTTAPPPPMETRMQQLEDVLGGLTRQVMLQQFYLEEKIRSDGSSGIKQVRVSNDGTMNYYSPAHVGRRFIAIHDHANYDRTVGMGEMLLVMNGVEFRTRHNDYKMRMPSRTDSGYHSTEWVPFPPVPPSVTAQPTVNAQILEMREYFRAFKEQNITHRDYRPYFQANLCYIEGAWTTGTKTLDEPFQSDRHQIDANNWFDLMDKIRYTSYTGSKSIEENFAFLPTTINSVDDEGIPHYAQWNYRILCHPVQGDVPLGVFKADDDLTYRFPNRRGMDSTYYSRAQRYHINEKDINHYSAGNSLLDNLMMQIPGKNNYHAVLHDNSFDMEMHDVRYSNNTLINTGFYHRYFRTMDKGAMGEKSVHRGYSDQNLWVAQTTHPQVAPMSVKKCHGHNANKVCQTWSNRYTYALPLEFVYTTPLSTWNPYDLNLTGTENDVKRGGQGTGGRNFSNAYNGSNYRFWYLTPSDFYSNGDVDKDSADTAKKGAGVLDKNGVVRIVDSSGIRITTPNIEGVGTVRLRYPIMPVHGEGSGVWKELNALKEMTMHMNRYASLFEERPGLQTTNDTDESATIHYQVAMTIQDPPGEHNHDFFINREELDEIKKGQHVEAVTSEDMGHSHRLELKWSTKREQIQIHRCDGLRQCWDGHPLGSLGIL